MVVMRKITVSGIEPSCGGFQAWEIVVMCRYKVCMSNGS